MPLCELCNKSAAFGVVGGPPLFCKTHKETGMFNVVSKRCEYSGCSKINPAFDFKGGKGRFCRVHKEAEMINVKSKCCEHPECNKPIIYSKSITSASSLRVSPFWCDCGGSGGRISKVRRRRFVGKAHIIPTSGSSQYSLVSSNSSLRVMRMWR